MSTIKTHRDLDVWKKSVLLVTTVYEVTKGFPKEEIYGITNQIRRLNNIGVEETELDRLTREFNQTMQNSTQIHSNNDIITEFMEKNKGSNREKLQRILELNKFNN